MRPDRWEQTYVEFVTARQHELRQVALATYRDPVRAEDALRRGLTDLYLAWPRVRREGIEDAEALRLVAGSRARATGGAGSLLVADPDAPPHLVEEYVAAGRRARRRRRRTAVTAALVAVLVTAGVTWVVLPRSGGGGIGPDPLPPHPTASTMPIPVTLLVPPKRYVHPDSPPVLYLYGRMFKRSRDVTVLTTSGTPEPSTHPRGGAIVRVGGTTRWVVTVGSQPEALTEQRDGPYDPDAFRAWLGTEQAVLSGRLALAATAPGGYRAPVSDEDSPAIFAGTRLVAKAGGVVTQRITQPQDSRAAVRPCHDQAVRIHTASQDWFVLGYLCPAGGALYSEPVGVRATTLTSWLGLVRRVQDRFGW
jgi:hypothetical protein